MRPTTALIAVLVAAEIAAAAADEPIRVAVAPLSEMAEQQRGVRAAEQLIPRAVGAVPGFFAVPEKELRTAIRKANRRDLEACEGQLPCLAELGRLVRATVVLSGEAADLGDGQVVYLKAVDVSQANEFAKTTVILDASGAEADARKAAFRLLAPERYQGTLELAIDMDGAAVFLDGGKMGTSPIPPLKVLVGTHALRVTHERYRDFVRFVDIRFEATTPVEVAMGAFPIVRDDMQQKPKRPATPAAPLPWYRRWWVAAGVGGAVLLGTALVVASTTDAIDRDREVTVGGPP